MGRFSYWLDRTIQGMVNEVITREWQFHACHQDLPYAKDDGEAALKREIEEAQEWNRRRARNATTRS